MAICCWFNTTKKYAYQISRFMRQWEMEKVIVKECMVCGSKTITKPTYSSGERESYLCDTQQEVITISRVNGIPLLGELK